MKPPLLGTSHKPRGVRFHSMLRVLLALLFVGGGLTATASPAQALGNNYPWATASMSQMSPLSFYYRYCTDYAAWTLNTQLGGSTTDIRFKWSDIQSNNSGHAKDWKQGAINRGKAHNDTPAIGAVAWWGSSFGGGLGHVAIVADYGADWVKVHEYNYNVTGGFGERTIYRNTTAWPESFLHIADVTQPAPAPADLAVQLIHHWQSGSGATDAVKVKPDGTISGGQTTIGAVAPGNGQFGLGHFNNDSILDLYLVVTQGDSSGKSVIFVAAGPSYNTFLATVQTPMGQFDSNHGDVVIGDFTGDGKFDVGVLFANNGASNAAFGVLNAATNFQSWSYLNNIPIGGHDGARSDAVAGDFNHDQVVDLGVGFHQGTPSGNVDMFVLSGSSSYQSVSGNTLPLGGWQNGDGQLLNGRFSTGQDQIGAVYTSGTPTGKPDLFVLNGMNTIAGAWTLNVGSAPSNQRTFVGM